MNMHPGGASVFYDEDISGQDATTQFFNLHRLIYLFYNSYDILIILII